jgi:ABC-type dipeptide/oligopeptide/nickel transport system ATPase component
MVPHRFIGFKDKRQELVAKFLAERSENNLCTITGFSGVGKSALARSTIHFVQERNFLSGGSIWINGRHCNEYLLFLKSLLVKLLNDPGHAFKDEIT